MLHATPIARASSEPPCENAHSERGSTKGAVRKRAGRGLSASPLLRCSDVLPVQCARGPAIEQPHPARECLAAVCAIRPAPLTGALRGVPLEGVAGDAAAQAQEKALPFSGSLIGNKHAQPHQSRQHPVNPSMPSQREIAPAQRHGAFEFDEEVGCFVAIDVARDIGVARDHFTDSLVLFLCATPNLPQ